MIARWAAKLRRVRRWFSRSEWAIRLLGLSHSDATSNEPGLILLQIDGLSKRQFERAVQNGSMPFLRHLMHAQKYRQHSFYSGIPSTTPAVQAELFYGEPCAVPAFSFRDHRSGKIVQMFDQEPAQDTEARLQSTQRGLLEGGSSYSNLYTGGAAEAHFCAPTVGWGDVFRAASPATVAGLAAWHIGNILKVLALALVECGLALFDFVHGLLRGHHLHGELKTVVSRILVGIGLREFVTIGAKIDVARGLPIIHANFLGYDEQAHRRGPGSKFAHWSLKGIDGCVRRIYQAAKQSNRRDYEVWVYSDHGQQASMSYQDLHGRPVEEAVADVLGEHPVDDERRAAIAAGRRGEQSQRAAWVYRRKAATPAPTAAATPAPTATVAGHQVVAMGPLGHLYLNRESTGGERQSIGRRLVDDAKIPLVCFANEAGEVSAITGTGVYRLPEQIAEVVGRDHPFLDEVGDDTVRLCHHPDAGDLVFSGLSLAHPFVSFPLENGAHGGPGPDESEGFALLPRDVALPARPRSYLRAVDLRQAALHRLGRDRLPEAARTIRRRSQPATLRVMTYNVHSCIGMDGRLSPARIARVIAQHEVDVVALQEIDVRRRRTGGVDQAREIAERLAMMVHFFPAVELADEQYGDAILSRLPMKLRRAGPLPGAGKPHRERRGALWVEVDFDGLPVQLFNTHFGLALDEQLVQAEALLGRNWLSHLDCQPPVVVCGDFNAHPRSAPYRMLQRQLADAQLQLKGHRPKPTWFSGTPFHRIDHIFVSGGLTVRSVEVPKTDLVDVASDHLPLIVELSMAPAAVASSRGARNSLVSN